MPEPRSNPEPVLRPLRGTPALLWALAPVLGLVLLCSGTIGDPGWLAADPVEAPTAPYDPSQLEPTRRDWIRAHPPQGVALGLYSMDPHFDYGPWLDEIAALGATWVELIVNHYQKRVDSSHVAIGDPRTAPWHQVARTVEQAHARGLRVHLMPILLIRDAGPLDWRGTIDPADLDRWHRSYRAWIVRTARDADRIGVEALCVGSELNSRQGDRDEWLRTIAGVREIYRGAITYSANWDSYDSVPFASALDAIGATTYHPVASDTSPSVEALIARWLPLRNAITAWQRSIDVPLIFTEVGYPSIDGAAMHPWDYTADGAIDLGEQRDCLAAFTSVWQDVPELTGLFFFHWWGEGGPEDRSYTTRGKPALEVVEEWFRRRPGEDAQGGTR